MENVYDNLHLLNKCKLSSEQVILENNITLEQVEEVKKVLSCSACCDLDMPVECLRGECRVTGKVVFNVVYLTANDELGNQMSACPFDCKMVGECLDVGTKLNASAYVVSTEVGKTQGNQIKVVATINVDGVAVLNKEMPYLKDSGEGIFCKLCEQQVVSLKSQNCEKFEELLSATVKDGVKKVLMTNVECVVKEWSAGKNFVSVQGDLYAKVLYANGQDISELQTITISREFKQEIEAEGVQKECDLEVFASVLGQGVLVELEEKENGETVIEVKAPVMVCYNVFEKNNVMTAGDVYSTTDIISVQKDEGENFVPYSPEYLEGKIEGNVVLSNDEPRVDKYLCTTNVYNKSTSVYVADGKMTLQGIALATVVYLNDELGAVSSVEIEIPYVIDKKVDLQQDVILQPNVCLCDVDVMVKRGREIYFDAKVKAYVNVCAPQKVAFVSKTEVQGALAPRDNAIEIYFAKAGETFWDIAKNLKISSEIISSQNPNLTDPLETDQNIAIYFQKQRV